MKRSNFIAKHNDRERIFSFVNDLVRFLNPFLNKKKKKTKTTRLTFANRKMSCRSRPIDSIQTFHFGKIFKFRHWTKITTNESICSKFGSTRRENTFRCRALNKNFLFYLRKKKREKRNSFCFEIHRFETIVVIGRCSLTSFGTGLRRFVVQLSNK